MRSPRLRIPLLAFAAIVSLLASPGAPAQETSDLILPGRSNSSQADTSPLTAKVTADRGSVTPLDPPSLTRPPSHRGSLIAGTELIQDGSFESGPPANAFGFSTFSSSWDWYYSGSGGGYNPRYTNSSTGAAHSGNWAVYFDFGPSENQLSQRVTIPANSTSTLSFWLKIGGTSPSALDTFGVNFTDINGTAVQTFVKNYRYYTNYPGGYYYVHYTYDVSALAGLNGYILFWTKMSGSTIFMLDDVSLVTTVSAPPPASGTCTEDSLTLCLVNGRYRVTSHWLNQYASPPAASILNKTKLSDKTGAFFVGDPATYEYLIRFNTTTNNGRAWVAITTFTDVEFWVNVTDTVTGLTKEYHSAPGNKTLLYDPNTFVFP